MTPFAENLRPVIDELAKHTKDAIDLNKVMPSDAGPLIACCVTALALQCEQLQRIGHTLHRIDGSLEAILIEMRHWPKGAPG